MAELPPQVSSNSELASFGEELRREREIRSISLKEIADATKISKRFLEALERNDHKTLPAPVFTRGFVREYARYLGLNSDEMVNRYNYAASGDERIEKTAHLERLVQLQNPPPPKQGIPPPYARIDRNIYILAAIMIALAAVSVWAIRSRRQSRAAELAQQETAARAVPNAQEVSPPAEPPGSDSVLRLTLELTGDSWIVLEADGKTVINDVVRSGERRRFEAKDRFRFRRIGNAGGVALTLNDRRLPPLGGEGEVVKERVFDRTSLEQLPADASRSTT